MSLLNRQNRQSYLGTITTSLVVLAFLVVAAKYVAPILYYISERLQGRPLADVPVLWDFWWPLYLIVAAAISNRQTLSWPLFITLAGLRILFSVVVLTLFFANPSWNYWNLHWLFYEILTLLIMAGGLILAQAPTVRKDLSTNYRPLTNASEIKTF